MFKRIQNSLSNWMLTFYFVFGCFMLPAPITWANIYAILDYRNWFNKKDFRLILLAFLVLSIYSFFHLYYGVVLTYYFKSSAFFAVLIISAFSLKNYLKTQVVNLPKIFEYTAIISFLLFLIAFVLYWTPMSQLLWLDHDFIGEGDTINRYKAFAYEPSHLAIMLSPVCIYYFLMAFIKRAKKDMVLLACIAIPILFTLSFGFVLAFGIAFLIAGTAVLWQHSKLKRNFWIFTGGSIALFLLMIFTKNPLADRMHMIFNGKDTSVNGRTIEAFDLAFQCAEEKNKWTGIGLGQIKVIGEDVIRPFYQKRDPVGYSKENWPRMAIPNASAETLAQLGIIGLILRLGLQVFLFFKCKVTDNWFQFFVFFFVFSYQLMGSFLFSTAEVLLWIFAFYPLFPNLNRKNQVIQEV